MCINRLIYFQIRQVNTHKYYFKVFFKMKMTRQFLNRPLKCTRAQFVFLHAVMCIRADQMLLLLFSFFRHFSFFSARAFKAYNYFFQLTLPLTHFDCGNKRLPRERERGNEKKRQMTEYRRMINGWAKYILPAFPDTTNYAHSYGHISQT